MSATDTTNSQSVDDKLADEAEELDGYFSDAPLDPQPEYPPLDTSLDTAIILANLPKVNQSRLERLVKVVTKTVSRIGPLASSPEADFDGVYMPYDKEKDSTLGFCLVEYETPEDAKKAVEVLQGYKFDKLHFLTATSLQRAKQIKENPDKAIPKEFVPPAPEPFVEPPRAVAWMEDPHQRDEFVVRFGTETVVNWWDGGGKGQPPAVDYDGSREKEAGVLWCEYYCHWSPQGSYLATLLPARGVILWSGPEYTKVGRFVAPGVKQILFSPQENYLLTNNMDIRDPTAIKVYDIATGKLLRAFGLFPEKKDDKKDVDPNLPPPAFQWSHDDKYLARQSDDMINIFETPSMRLLDKRSLATPGISDFQWSPTDNILAYWVSTVAFIAIRQSVWGCRYWHVHSLFPFLCPSSLFV